MRNHNFQLSELISWNIESILKIRMYDLEYLMQEKLCLSVSMQDIKEKFGEVFRREKRRRNDGRI